MKLQFPVLPVYRSYDGPSLDTRKHLQCGEGDPTGTCFFERKDHLFTKDGLRPTSLINVDRDGFEMFGINTLPDTAEVVYGKSLWYFAFVQFVVVAMCQLVASTYADMAIPIVTNLHLPYPARRSISSVFFNILHLASMVVVNKPKWFTLLDTPILVRLRGNGSFFSTSTPAVAISAISVNMSHYLGLLSGLVSAGVDSTAVDVFTSLSIPEGRSFAH